MQGEASQDNGSNGCAAANPERALRSGDDRVIHEGVLCLLKKEKEESRYFALFENHFEYHLTQEDMQKGEKPRGKADYEAVTHFEVIAGVMVITIGARKLELKSPSSDEFARWTEVWYQVLDLESASEDGEEEEEELEEESGEQTDQTYAKPNLVCSGRLTMTIVASNRPLDVSSRVVLLTLREDRLEYFTKSLDSAHGVPDGTIKIEEIEDLEIMDNGFLIHTHVGWHYRLSDPIGKTISEWLEQFSHVFEKDDEDDYGCLPRDRARTEGALGSGPKMHHDDDDDDDDETDGDDEDDIEPSAEQGLSPGSQGEGIKPVQGTSRPVVKPLDLSSSPLKSNGRHVAPRKEPQFTHDFTAGSDKGLDLCDMDVQQCGAALLEVIEKTNAALDRGREINGRQISNVRTFFQACDSHGRGTIDVDQFISGLRRLRVAVPSSSLELIFRVTQDSQSGGVQLQELSKVLSISTESAALLRAEKLKSQPLRRTRKLKTIHSPLERTDQVGLGQFENISTHAKDLAVKQMLTAVHSCMNSGRSLFGIKITDAKSLFSALDRNSDGALDRDEVSKGLKRLGCVHSEEQLDRLFYTLESINDNGDIDLAAFEDVLGCRVDEEAPDSQQRSKPERRRQGKAAMSSTQVDSMPATVEVGPTLQHTVENLDFAAIDKNGDGEISPDEWEQFQRDLVSSLGHTSRPVPGEMQEPSPYETLKAAPTSPKRFSFTNFPIIAIHEGPVDFCQSGSSQKMYAVLYRNKIELYKSLREVKTAAPVTVFAFDNLERVKASKGMFELRTASKDFPIVQLRVQKGYEGWRTAMEEALNPIFDYADDIWINDSELNFKPRPSVIGHSDSTPIHEGPLKLVRRGYTEVRYFLVYADRFEHYTDAASARRGLSSGGRVWAVDVRSVRVVDNAFVFGLERESLDVRVPVGEEMESWIQAFQTMFHKQDVMADGGAGIDSIARPQRTNMFKDVSLTTQALFAESAAELADERVQAWLRSMPDQPVFSGLLGFQCQGKMVCRMSVLFKDRLDSWSSPLKASLGAKLESSIPLSKARGVETISGGFIVNLGGRKVGIHVGDNESLYQWSKVLIPALVPSNQSKRRTASPSPEPWPVNISGRTPVGTNMRASPRAKSPPRQVRPQGWVPRVATLKTKSSANNTDRQNPRTTLVFSHTGPSSTDGRFKVDTDRNGMVAGKAIHGSASALLATSSAPGLKKYVKSEVASKIGQSSTSPLSNSARIDRSQATPKVGSEDRVLSRRRDTLSSKIGEGDRKPLTARSASQPVIGKVTDAGRESSCWASPNKNTSLVQKATPLAQHAAAGRSSPRL